MANLKIPNLCGANAEFNAVQTKFESLLSDAVAGLESGASSLASTLDSAAASLTSDLRDLIPEVPSLPEVNLQSLLTSLSSLTPGTSDYIALLAKIKTDFETELTAAGQSLDTLVTNARAQLDGGGDLCSVVPNFVKAADGLTPAKEIASESKQPDKDASEEEPSTLVQNAEVVAQRTGLGLRVKKMITEASTAEDVVADTVTSTTLPTEDVGAFGITAKNIEIVSTDGLKVKVTTAKDASVETIETEETDIVTGVTTSSTTEVKNKTPTAQTSAIGSIPSEVNTSTSAIEPTPKNKVTTRTTKTEKKNVSSEGFSSRPAEAQEGFLIEELINNSVTLRHTPISIKRVMGFYSDDNKQGNHVFARKRRGKKRSGYDILVQEDSGTTKPLKASQTAIPLDTYTSNGKVLTITQDVSGPYEGTPAGTTKEWLRKLRTGTALLVKYRYNATYDPRFVKDD